EEDLLQNPLSGELPLFCSEYLKHKNQKSPMEMQLWLILPDHDRISRMTPTCTNCSALEVSLFLTSSPSSEHEEETSINKIKDEKKAFSFLFTPISSKKYTMLLLGTCKLKTTNK
ncbi:hypothetical protein OWV82_010801, partial [Melia azedarach]